MKPREVRAALRDVLRAARKAGFRVPKGIQVRVDAKMSMAYRGYCHTSSLEIVVNPAYADYELICHEVAHLLADQLVIAKSAAHNRFWAAIYGVLYQATIEK